MGRDAPADLDALLTSREREVLELLRPGLTNGEIAGRLGISVAGVRYHVSEIIGKLGVRNRYEAAAWPARPPWWLAAAAPVGLFWRQAKALAPLKLSSAALLASGGLLAAALAGIGLILFLLLRDGDSTGLPSAAPCPSNAPLAATDDGGELTLEELTDRVAEAITCPGYALHLRSAGQFEAGPYSVYGEGDIWIDLERNQGRVESRSIPNSEELRQAAEEEGRELRELRSVTIFRSDGQYTAERAPENQAAKRRQPPGCHGPDRTVLALILPCEGPTEKLEMTVERNVAYRGSNAIAYVTRGTSRGSDETYDTTGRVFLDRDTFLPLGSTSEGTLDAGVVYPISYDAPFQYEFVPLDSLPPDFFDPASIGYVEKDPEEPLETQDFGVTVYWLGRGFEGGDGLPALALKSVFAGSSLDGRPFRPAAEIFYRAADDEFGWGMVDLEIYKPKDWEAFLAQVPARWWYGPCVQRREIELGDRSAVIYAGPSDASMGEVECPPPGKYLAHVYIGDAFVTISAPGLGTGTTYSDSPYNSETGIELLVRSLTPRQRELP